MSEKVVALVPALNWEKNFDSVLAALFDSKRKGLISDILVVDDGFMDVNSGLAREKAANKGISSRWVGKWRES